MDHTGREKKDPVSVAWNDKLLDKLDGEIQELKDQGKDIMLMGDFNSHIGGGGDVTGGGGPQRADRQGRIVTEAWERWGLKMINRSDKCSGRWARMRGESKSEIDVVAMEERCVNRVIKMVIHENGNFEVPQSDHNWIEVCIEHEGGREGKVDMTPGWNITKRSNWGQYRDMLNERLRLWRVEREAGGQAAGDIEITYQALVSCIVGAATESIGVKRKSNGGRKSKFGQKMRDLIKRRNEAGREWRRELVGGGPHIQEKWATFK